MNLLIYIISFIICVSANNNSEITFGDTDSTKRLNNENLLQVKINPEILYQKRLRSINHIPDVYKTVTSYHNGSSNYFIEIVTKWEHFGTPLYSKSYRMPDKFILTPYQFLEIIEFISSRNINNKDLGRNLYITRFENPYHIILRREAGLLNSKYRILFLDWLEIQDLLSCASNILYDTYKFII